MAIHGRTGMSGAIVIVHDMVLGLVLSLAIITLLGTTTMLRHDVHACTKA